MEYLDLVDDNDNVIGKEDRDAIYAKGMKNFRAINIFIFNAKGEILVPLRSSNRRIFPNCFDYSVSGHVDSGETYLEAAYRELKEELEIEGVQLEEVGYFHPIKTDTVCFSRLYRFVYDGEIKDYDEDGIDSIHYFSIHELKKLVAEEPERFKGDFPKIFNWYIENYDL